MFMQDDVNDSGIFGVNITKNGRRMRVVLDDFIPCTVDGHPAFTQNKGPEMWVICLEKAWAKVHGSYERIVAGIVH